MQCSKMVKISELITQNTKTEKITDMENEHYITLSLYGKGVRERVIKDGKYPVPFLGYKVSAGQFIYSRIDARNGAYGIIPPELEGYVVSKDFPIYNINTNKVLPQFLLRSVLSNSFIRQVKNSSFGATNRMRIKEEVLENYTISLPPIEKQAEITERLDKVELIISQRQNEINLLNELVKARFVELFGDPIRNEKGWKTCSLTDACLKIFGGGTPSKSHPEYFEGLIPWVSPKDMKSDVITDSIDHITEEAITNSTTTLVPKESVLMVIRSGILKHHLPVAINAVPVTINQDMKAFVPGQTITASFLRSYFVAIESDVLSGVRGVTADNIDFKSFQQRAIIIPPLDLQIAFESFCKQVDKSKVVVQKSLDETKKLFDSLMQEYFG